MWRGSGARTSERRMVSACPVSDRAVCLTEQPTLRRRSGCVPGMRGQEGLTYLWVLLMVAGLGWGLAAVAQLWTTYAARERERELLFVGEQFRRAIASYYESTPQPMKQFPRALADLIEDRRFPIPRRHLRRLYADPMSGTRDWGLVLAADKSIMGVYSKGQGTAFRTSLPKTVTLEGDGYGRWQFVYVIGAPATGAGGAPSASGVAASPPTGIPSQVPAAGLVPVDISTAPSAPAPVPVQKPQTEAPKKPNECVGTRASDMRACAALGADPAAFERCLRDSNRRYAACIRGAGAAGLASP